MHYGALEIITVIDSALRKLEERTLKEDIVLKSLSRNGFLEYKACEAWNCRHEVGEDCRPGLEGPAA